jgi:ATP diphosphatase
MTENLTRLLKIMAQLRNPDSGCPWDVAQTYASIAPYTIEEAYEVADAIQQNDIVALKDELGDLLLQVVFHSRIGEEAGDFDFDAVAGAIADKMVRRHPHVFGSETHKNQDAQRASWETQKAAERQEKAETSGQKSSAIDGVPLALPALTRAEKLGKRAARVGFEWPDLQGPLEKLQEELSELRYEINADAPPERLSDEIGDVLFSVVNLARHLSIDPESALRHCNAKFERRFRFIEDSLAAEGRDVADTTLDDMEDRWNAAKRTE